MRFRVTPRLPLLLGAAAGGAAESADQDRAEPAGHTSATSATAPAAMLAVFRAR
jgi:hypothetical protein